MISQKELDAINEIWQNNYDSDHNVGVEGNEVVIYDTRTKMEEARLQIEPPVGLREVISALSEWLPAREKQVIKGIKACTAGTRIHLLDYALKNMQ
jgi:hypothetical protein